MRVPRAGLQKLVAEFAEFAAGCRAPAEFWPGVMRFLQSEVGFDAGYVATTLGSTHDAQGGVVEHDGEALRANIGIYLSEITTEELGSYMTQARGHLEIWGQSRRANMRVFREVLEPTGVKHLAVRASLRKNTLLGFNLERRSGHAFKDAELRLIDAITPLVHLGDAVTRSWAAGEASLPWAEQYSFTPRELEMAELVTRGLQNREIAKLLNVSDLTVRNTLVRVYEKMGVSSRTELTYEALRGAGEQGREGYGRAGTREDRLRIFYEKAMQAVKPTPFELPEPIRPPSVIFARPR